ncbi:hypothetical protein [Neolewinella persica]|uniref:hypothetical protein n=1 Tax=Neolewinella persica TaxID=70998 RepID=UPI00035D4DC9|nr:hypothetical protein [Neolewinella persica]
MSDSSSQLLDDNALPGEYAVYQRFNREEDMLSVLEVLKENNILVRHASEDQGEWRESTIIGSPLQPKFWIEIPANQFEKANFMLQEAADEALSEEDLQSHPFADYSKKDLEEVLLEETDWSPEAVVVARRLLLSRGHDVDLAKIRQAAREKIAKDYTPKSGNRLVIIFFSLFGSFSGLSIWFTSVLIALGVLLYYVVGSRRDPKGNKHPAYDTPTRQFGRIGLGLMVVCTILGLLNFFYLHWVRFPEIDPWYWIWL